MGTALRSEIQISKFVPFIANRIITRNLQRLLIEPSASTIFSSATRLNSSSPNYSVQIGEVKQQHIKSVPIHCSRAELSPPFFTPGSTTYLNQANNTSTQINPYRPNGTFSSPFYDSMQNLTLMTNHKSPILNSYTETGRATFQPTADELVPNTANSWSPTPPISASFSSPKPPQNVNGSNADILWNAFHGTGGCTSYTNYSNPSQNFNSTSSNLHSQILQHHNRCQRRQQNCPYPQMFGLIQHHLRRQPGQNEISQAVKYQTGIANNTANRDCNDHCESRNQPARYLTFDNIG
ncbi:hypothetical protein ACTXT7_013648 [Hymenolepis weldensis]